MRETQSPCAQPWQVVSEKSVFECRNFSVRKLHSRPPHADHVHHVHVLGLQDWVNIVPITPNGDLVLVRQFRHGIAAMTLELPAGLMEPTDADPGVAARREMLEETGYDSDDVESLGFTHPNPALQNNRCHMFVARDVVLRGVPQNSQSEYTEPVLVRLDSVPQMIQSGVITHALAIAAFHVLLITDSTRDRGRPGPHAA